MLHVEFPVIYQFATEVQLHPSIDNSQFLFNLCFQSWTCQLQIIYLNTTCLIPSLVLWFDKRYRSDLKLDPS